jgi:hypothetical protein
MGKVYEEITPALAGWIGRQKVFFVASAPLAGAGHVNCSPKGLDSLRVLDAHTVAYGDYTGSGAETAAHLVENGRIVLMFCAFEGPPKIVRLHGRGEVVLPGSTSWDELATRVPVVPATRSIVRVRVARVSDSCGFGVPRMDFVGERDAMDQWLEKKGLENLPAYRRQKNARSIDGLETGGFGDGP